MGLVYSFLRESFPPAPHFTAESVPDLSGKVALITGANAGIAHLVGNLQFDTFMDGPKRKAKQTFWLYGQSKTGNIVFSAELHRRYHDQGIVSTALNPGAIRTELIRYHHSFVVRIGTWLLWDVSYGALTQLYTGTALDAGTLGGQYLVPWARIGTPRADTQDPQLGKELWAWLEEQVAKL
ncbi:hypothetical protein OG21DRAFT_1520886 [Imleria badia]|nr:hypothetical protein OG21DRAFT_1520886 [Imleria badia]